MIMAMAILMEGESPRIAAPAYTPATRMFADGCLA
jgi:hypothetical protein